MKQPNYPDWSKVDWSVRNSLLARRHNVDVALIAWARRNYAPGSTPAPKPPTALRGRQPAPDALLTVPQLAQALQVTTRTIYIWKRDGTIPASAIQCPHSTVRISWAEVQKAMQRREPSC